MSDDDQEFDKLAYSLTLYAAVVVAVAERESIVLVASGIGIVAYADVPIVDVVDEADIAVGT